MADERAQRARRAAERLRRAVADHAAESDCGEPDCLLHRISCPCECHKPKHEARKPHADTMAGR